jgi:membrane protease YdiL (CAAX protease family)
MNTLLGETSTVKVHTDVLATSTKRKLLAILEVLVVYACIQSLLVFWSSTGILQWEKRNFGWSYIGVLIMVGIPALVMWLTRRNWAEYGVSLADWPTNLDIGMKAYLVAFIPYVFGWLSAPALGLDPLQLSGGVLVALTGLIALALMVWILNRHKPIQSGRTNVTIVLLLLLLPVAIALPMRKLSVPVVSTVVWQFVFSGFGEEFVWRGYVQSRLNGAFGRPLRLFGIQFGPGLIIASLLFGLLHAFNTFDSAIGLPSLSWGWALSTFVGGLFFGVIREKTGTLVAPGIAHGLPDAVGEALMKMFTWM